MVEEYVCTVARKHGFSYEGRTTQVEPCVSVTFIVPAKYRSTHLPVDMSKEP